MSETHPRTWSRVGLAAAVCALILATGLSCARRPAPVIDAALRERSQHPPGGAVACASCHRAIFEEWAASQHARANRLVSDAEDRAAFEPRRRVEHGSFVTEMKGAGGDGFLFAASFSNGAPETFRAEAVIGITPLRQYLVSHPGGRLQAVDMGFDPRSNEWFNVFGDEDRQPHEWGHWRNRSMTWNAQCAFCHMTGFEKNYDPVSDTYASSWQAMGIACAQCHVNVRPATRDECAVTGGVRAVSAGRGMENCASCHARREELFGTFKPGDAFDDHFRLALPDQPGVFHADGQVREEDFEYASFLMSRMGHKGVTCLDCHAPHSAKLLLPVENNALCMRCHASPGAKGAIPIDPTAHSFHRADSPGNRCVECHMPLNTYMMRDGRRDHGFTIPDPLMTVEHGIPNACNRCHTDRSPGWAEEYTRTWYGNRMERRTRERTRVVARAHAGDAGVVTQLVALAAGEEIAAWRAALAGLLRPWNGEPAVDSFLRGEAGHASPLVRSAALRARGEAPVEALSDPSALVRVDAALLRYEQDPRSRPSNMAEVLAYLDNISDQPAGALRQAQRASLENRPADAEFWAARALAWDPSAVPHHVLGRLQFANGKPAEAVSNLHAAASLERDNAEYSFALALALAESGNPPNALPWLEETVRRAPEFGRAWYNLGLAYASAERLAEAVSALRRAETLMPGSGDPAYARATVHLRLGDRPAAAAALRAALGAEPGHAGAARLEQQLSAPPRRH